MAETRELTNTIKQFAREEGFDLVGIAPAKALEWDYTDRFRQWLGNDWHASMEYMATNVEKRFSPQLMVQGAGSVICLAVGYTPDASENNRNLVARYARGRDYHKVLKKRCHKLMDRIRGIAPEFDGRAFVDSAPVMERTLAALARLGWIGRNGSVITEKFGSYVLLCEIICNLPLVADEPVESQCRDCGRCVEACPTSALIGDGTVDSNKCISYLTIEHRDAIDEKYWPLMGSRIFGCDACQESCPFNKDVAVGDEQLRGVPLGGVGLADILSWSCEDWDAATQGSAIRRAKFEMLLRNVVIAAGNSGDRTLKPKLEKLRTTQPELEKPIGWALKQLK